MAWPQSQDYNEAIQNPQSSFGDAELRGGQAVINALGMPMPRSGNFADVYEFIGASGQKWAVKCFTRQVPGLQERYGEISKHLVQARLPFTVDFSYLAKGIRIRGEFYPILKMQWVEGFLLNEFVRDNLDKPALLDALGQIWVRMAERLGEANIAHADLQHGNVILVPGRKAASLAVKLIDYDGMWLPALAKSKSGEVGHPNYQHPERFRQGTYSAAVDRLPVLAIACALRCLAVGGKTLWDKYDNGDNLLFRETDLRDPGASGLFKELWNINDAASHDLTGYLAAALIRPLAESPLLQDLIKEDRLRPLSAAEEKNVTELLGPGAIVNRSAAAGIAMKPLSKLKAGTPPPASSARAGAAASSEWDFAGNEQASPRVPRNSPAARSTKIWVAAAVMFGVFAVCAVGFWATRKGEPAKAVDVAMAEPDLKEPKGSAVKPKPLPDKIELKEPELPADRSDLPAKSGFKQPETPAKGTAPARAIVWDHVNKSFSGVRDVDGYLSIEPTSWISTKKCYAGPVEITAIARTTGENIRLHAFNGLVIFNWELNPSQLRVLRPDGTLGVAQVKPLLPNTWYKINWRLWEKGMRISVDDNIVYEDQKAYNLADGRPVSLRAYNDRIGVQQLSVARLPGLSVDQEPVIANKNAESPSIPIKITPDLVTKKFKGKVAYDEETGKLTLTYDFKTATQTKDFELEYVVPDVRPGFLRIEAPGSAKHIVKFKNVTISTVAIMNATQGKLLITSEGAILAAGGGNNSSAGGYFSFAAGATSRSLPVPANERQGAIPIGLNIQPREFSARFGSKTVECSTQKSHAGFIELCSGDSGCSFSQLTLTGTMDDEWAQEFFAERATPTSPDKKAPVVAEKKDAVNQEVPPNLQIPKEATKKTELASGATWDHVNKSATGVKEIDGYLSIEPGSLISTKESYAAPIAISVIARTASRNIRLYAFNGASVIFNWEVNSSELRVTRPGAGFVKDVSVATARVKPLLLNTWYRLGWRITEQGMTIKVDDKTVFEEKREYKLSAHNGPVSVNAYDRRVDVKQLSAEPVSATDLAQNRDGPDQKREAEPAQIDISSALLKKKFHGQAKYDKKTGTLSLSYDFQARSQLKDFELSKDKGVLGNGFLLLAANEHAKHIVEFKEVTIKGLVMVKTMGGSFVNTSGGTCFRINEFPGRGLIYIERRQFGAGQPLPKNDQSAVAIDVAKKDYKGLIPVIFTISGDGIAFKYGSTNLTHSVKGTQAGFVEFFGGDVGYNYRRLSFVGTMNDDWANEFFADTNSAKHDDQPKSVQKR